MSFWGFLITMVTHTCCKKKPSVYQLVLKRKKKGSAKGLGNPQARTLELSWLLSSSHPQVQLTGSTFTVASTPTPSALTRAPTADEPPPQI